MKYDPNLHHRRSIRLQGYDYTQPGAYFITIVTFQRQEKFGEITNGQMHPSTLGNIVREEWFRSTKIRKEIRLFDDEFVVMPNHIHGIVWIVRTDNFHNVGVDGVNPQYVTPPTEGERRSPLHTPHQMSKSLSSFVAGYKSVVTGRAKRELDIFAIWQRNFYDHIIRNENELKNIWNYIDANHQQWKDDQLHPSTPPNKFNRMQK